MEKEVKIALIGGIFTVLVAAIQYGPDILHEINPLITTSKEETRMLAVTSLVNPENKSLVVNELLPKAIGIYSPSDPKVGEIIIFNASQSQDKNGRITNYEWDFGDGYSGNRASMGHSYTESGKYNVKLVVINDKGVKNSSIININVSPKIESINQIPQIVGVGLSPDKPSPQDSGTMVTWIAEASDPDNDQILYSFLLKGPATGGVWKSRTNWTTDNAWAWVTNSIDVGENQVQVAIRDGKHTGPNSSDSNKIINFLITNGGVSSGPPEASRVPKTTTYRINAFTGTGVRELSVDGAGTAGLVSITLYGEDDALNVSTGVLKGNKLEAGKNSIFDISDKTDVGNLKQIMIYYTGIQHKTLFGSWYDKWYPEKIVITNLNNGRSWTFRINGWMKDGPNGRYLPEN